MKGNVGLGFYLLALQRIANKELQEYEQLKNDIKKFKMARPTKAEQEKRRIAGLLAEGKGPDGELIKPIEPIEPKGVCQYCSSTFLMTKGRKFCPQKNGKRNWCRDQHNYALLKNKKVKILTSEEKKEVEGVLNDAKSSTHSSHFPQLLEPTLTWEFEYHKLIRKEKIAVKRLPAYIQQAIKKLKKIRIEDQARILDAKIVDYIKKKKKRTRPKKNKKGKGSYFPSPEIVTPSEMSLEQIEEMIAENTPKKLAKEPEPIVRTASDNKIAIAIAVISFLMSLYNIIW